MPVSVMIRSLYDFSENNAIVCLSLLILKATQTKAGFKKLVFTSNVASKASISGLDNSGPPIQTPKLSENTQKWHEIKNMSILDPKISKVGFFGHNQNYPEK